MLSGLSEIQRLRDLGRKGDKGGLESVHLLVLLLEESFQAILQAVIVH